MIDMPRRQPLTSRRKTRKKQKRKGLIMNNLKNMTPPEEAGGKTKEQAKRAHMRNRKPRIPIRSVAIVTKCVTRASFMSHTHMQRSPTHSASSAGEVGYKLLNESEHNTSMTFWFLLPNMAELFVVYNLVFIYLGINKHVRKTGCCAYM